MTKAARSGRRKPDPNIYSVVGPEGAWSLDAVGVSAVAAFDAYHRAHVKGRNDLTIIDAETGAEVVSAAMLVAEGPLVVAYGMGVDSTAMLIGMHERGIRPDKILFADTGSEKPETYAYLPVIQAWLAKVGFPPVEVVKRLPTVSRKTGRAYSTLEENCLEHEMLPSLAYGRKGCSLKWKREPQDRHVARWVPARLAWHVGRRVRKAIGYDNGPKDSKRAWNLKSDKRYEYVYPLREWGWDREKCKAVIRAAGLPVPVKSACFFCPAMKPEELEELHRDHPEYTARIIEIERRAAPNLTSIEGLWIRTTQGKRGARAKPGSMTVFLRTLPSGGACPS